MTKDNEVNPQVRVLLADDPGIMLRAISRLLDVTPEIALVGVAGNFEEAMRLADDCNHGSSF